MLSLSNYSCFGATYSCVIWNNIVNNYCIGTDSNIVPYHGFADYYCATTDVNIISDSRTIGPFHSYSHILMNPRVFANSIRFDSTRFTVRYVQPPP